MEIVINLEGKWWIEKKWHTKIVNWKRITVWEYESPDGMWKINLREWSKTEKEIAQAWYKVEATLDVIDVEKKKKWLSKKSYLREIKFILLK